MKIKIIFATVTGNTEAVSKYIQKKLLDDGYSDTELIRAEDVTVEVFNRDDVFVVAASTWNLGEMNQFLVHIYEELPKSDLTAVKMAFIGLGDRIYGEDHFCKSIVDFRKAALAAGIVELVEPLYIDGEPESQLDTVVSEWYAKFKEQAS